MKATVPFFLRPETWSPLQIRIGYDPVIPTSIDLQRDWAAGLPLDKIGFVADQLEEGLKKGIADKVNQAIEQSEDARRIDLLALVKESLAKMTGSGSAPAFGGAPTGGPDGIAGGATPEQAVGVKAGDKLLVRLESDKKASLLPPVSQAGGIFVLSMLRPGEGEVLAVRALHLWGRNQQG